MTLILCLCRFHLVGYGCMTCIGNSGPLPEEVVGAIEKVASFNISFFYK